MSHLIHDQQEFLVFALRQPAVERREPVMMHAIDIAAVTAAGISPAEAAGR